MDNKKKDFQGITDFKDKIFFDSNGKVCIDRRKELKLEAGDTITEYYIERTNMTLKEFAEQIIKN
jgi:hypothetical protein